jgi:DNA-binding transcriptional LysR family regulator
MTIARSGGFSLAQTELNVSQATISIHIKNLETRLGLTLCLRGRSGFALTEDGQRVYDAAQALFNHLDAFQSIVLGHEKLVGELQIGVIDNTIFHPTFKLSQAIQRFGEIPHHVDISVHVAPPNQLEQMVLSGQAHLAIGFFPRRLSQLIYEPVFTSDMELFCGSQHPLFKMPSKRISVAEIESFPHAQRGYVSQDQLPDNERNLQFRARAHNIEGLAQLILSGRYLASLPKHYARQWVRSGEMRSILPEKYQYTSVYELIRRKSAARTPAEVRFHSLLSGLSNKKAALSATK